MNGRGIRKESLVIESPSETVMLPPDCLKYKPDNRVVFLLEFEVCLDFVYFTFGTLFMFL